MSGLHHPEDEEPPATSATASHYKTAAGADKGCPETLLVLTEVLAKCFSPMLRQHGEALMSCDPDAWVRETLLRICIRIHQLYGGLFD